MIILVGAILLALPVSSKNASGVSFLDALFTSVSATCITGLSVFDTFTQWSFFGQAVILILIQTGGLGFMSFVAIASFVFKKRISFKQRMLMAESFSLDKTGGIVKLMRKVLAVTFSCEAAGALFLCIHFIPEFGFAEGLWNGVFHAVSAFCNAGFDLMGKLSGGVSLTCYADNLLVNTVCMSLIVIGGLGFWVWDDLLSTVNPHKWRTHTKIVISMTSFLILLGAVLFYFLERENAFAHLEHGSKVLAAFFQSVTTRTAGFCTVDSGSLSDASKLLTILLMFIGGSPASTAGGVKTVTVALIVFTAFSAARGRDSVHFGKRKISNRSVMQAVSIVIIALLTVLGALILLTVTEELPFLDLLFEAVSAFGTVGMSTGITSSLTAVGKIIIMCLMFFGRVGVLSLVLAFSARASKSKIEYPVADVLVG